MSSASKAFHPVRTALEAAGVRYASGGFGASTAFGEPRFTNDVDILADFSMESQDRFLCQLPPAFYADREYAQTALRLGRPFNVLYMPMVLNFDFFPAHAFPL